jgi:S-adenosylmethionine:tRNA ribosyltransferase-isomerase
MKLSDFDYPLPPERIAQTPAEPRDSSRLMVVHRDSGEIEHRVYRDILEYLRPGDVMVLNKTRVIPARLLGIKTETGGAVEVLLLHKVDDRCWVGLGGGRGLREGVRLTLQRGDISLGAVVKEVLDGPERVFCFDEPIESKLAELGETPLPPYITTPLENPERYQTVYSRTEGSAAAPTAGLHLTPELLLELQGRGILLAYCTLHIGMDTFQPVSVENIYEHKIHRERAILTPEDARIINEAKLAGGRIVGVGTTSARTLESAAVRSLAYGSPLNDPTSIAATLRNLPDAACPWRPVIALDEETDLFITPGYVFQAVDVLQTNFHLPKSTLLMMISAFAGYDLIMRAYRIAVEENYRFFSFGDAMLLI